MTHRSTTTPASLTALAVDALLTDSPTAHRDLDLAADRVRAVTRIRAHLTRAEIAAARADSYVLCTECGHPIADHEDEPCTTCAAQHRAGETESTCASALTALQFADLNAAYGLPRG